MKVTVDFDTHSSISTSLSSSVVVASILGKVRSKQ